MISDAPAIGWTTGTISWSHGDDLLLAELTRLVGLSAEETAALAALHEEAEGIAPTLNDTFYDRFPAAGQTQGSFPGADRSRMQRLTGQWFVNLFSGRYDELYVKGRLAIGLMLAEIGLPVRYPLALLDLTGELGERVAARSERPETALQAFRKVLSLDVAVFTQAYESSQRAG